MKLKFREKTYFLTLILFLVFFNIGIFSLAFYSYQNSMKGAESLCREEARVISEGFSKDAEYLNYNSTRKLLMKSYGERYSENGVCLAFIHKGDEKYSSLPEEIFEPEIGKSATQRANGKRYFVIAEDILNGEFKFIYAKDVSYLDEDFKSISAVFVATSVVASVLLSLCLFFVSARLSKPLEKLRLAASDIANGNFSSRATQRGNDEFSLLAADFNRMADHVEAQMDELQKSAETKQRMLDNLAHEMRTPLTSIRGYAEYLRDANIDENEKIEAIEFIISESERLKAIGETLLDEAFIRENKIHPSEVNLGELIFGISKKLSIKAANRGVLLKTEAEEILLNCDELLTELLISNLADNAIKACRGEGVVTIGCERTEDAIVISVSDNGIGMDKEQLAHITEPFYRTDKSRSREEGGTGLGLALCERIAQAHGAKLEFLSSVGEGTKALVTFTIL